MKTLRTILFLVASTASLLAAPAARAADPRFALGAGVSTYSTQVQGDLDFDWRAGVQAGIGAPLYGSLAWSLGGRYYFTRRHVAPYLGVLYANERWRDEYWYNRHYYYDRHEANLLGPTIGVRFHQRRLPGLGGFVQLELMQEMGDPGYWLPSLGAGIQWWF